MADSEKIRQSYYNSNHVDHYLSLFGGKAPKVIIKGGSATMEKKAASKKRKKNDKFTLLK